MQIRILFFGCCFLLLSCVNKQQNNLLSPQKMTDIITDLQLADAAYKLEMLPEAYKNNAEKYFLEILASHQTDTATYNASLRHYAASPELLQKIYLGVEKNIQVNIEKKEELKP